MSDQEKKMQESDFHQGAGHRIPFIIKLVWVLFFFYVIYYAAAYMYPNLVNWL